MEAASELPSTALEADAECSPRDPASISCRRAIDPSKTKPMERFSNRLDILEQALKGSLKEVTDQMSSEPVRQASMHIQALAKLYEAQAPDKKSKNWVTDFRKEIRELENAMGTFMRFRELNIRISKLEVPEKIREAVEERMEQGRKEFIEFLKQEGYLPDAKKKFDAFKKDVEKFEFAKTKKDHKLQMKAVLDMIAESEASIKSQKKFIEKADYTHEDLEAGLHSFRRDIRWVTIAIQASDGSFTYSQKAPSTREYFELVKDYGDSKFAQLSKPLAYAAELDPLPMLRMTRFISILGKLKDIKESQIDIAEILVSSGLEKNFETAMGVAQGIVSQKYGDVNVEALAQKYYREFQIQDPMKNLKKNIKAALD